MSRIRLLSTDFDGTLIGHPSDGRCSPAFATALRSHHAQGGLWAVNTGRGLDHMDEGVEIFSPPVRPDFALVLEREVYRRTAHGWEPYGEWNAVCRRRHAELFREAGEVFALIEEMAAASDNTITVVYEDDVPTGLVTTDEEVMEALTERLRPLADRHPQFNYQRNFIYLRFCHCDYHKGAALGELCRLEDIPREEVFAVGDHYNDLSMLDGVHAGMTACPANAIELVKETVRKSNGYVAEKPWADGVAEALDFYRSRQGQPDGVCV
ncbi:MAG: HAD family hydrolase [Terrimicrobiaceae bacterium]